MGSFFKNLQTTPDRRIAVGLLLFCLLLYIPFAGNYGMWDPWETHYGEVARQMIERGDYVSQWWPGSPQDRNEFWSKPVLTFWAMAIGMKVFGLGHRDAPGEMAQSWRAEWACRLPIILLSIAAIFAVWELVRRLAGRRAAAISALVLATSAQWALITRQAMTDMPFVATMTIALCFAGLALLLPEDEREAEVPRGDLRLGKWHLRYPRASAFYLFLLLVLLTVLPQLIVFSVQLQAVVQLGSTRVTLAGIVPMLPYFLCLFVGLWWCSRAVNRRQLYLFSAYVLCGLSCLAKGPAGVAFPVIIIGLYLAINQRWRDLIFKLEIPRGALLFAATAVPWFHAMLIRHGIGFWNEFIGDNYVHRAGGRHGDRGQLDYYITWIGYGLFPWSGFVVLGGLKSLFLSARNIEPDEARPRRALWMFALIWFLVDFGTVSLVNTKFHHYILPALPALAIFAGLLIDDLLTAVDGRRWLVALLAIALPVTVVCARDLVSFPARFLWLFNYDYVNMPGTGRPWPLPSIYGTRYEYGLVLSVLAALAVLFVLATGWYALRRNAADESSDTWRFRPVFWAVALVLLVVGIVSGPSGVNGGAPEIGRLRWLIACVVAAYGGWLLFAEWGRGQIGRWLVAAAGVGVLWSTFVIDGLLVDLSPHWSQKHVIAAYYNQRHSADEPLIAWQLYWRGENFYSKNQIYASPTQTERTVFLGDRNGEKMQQYFASHSGRRMFFVIEQSRLESLRQLLPAQSRSSLQVVEKSNNKLYLAVAQL